MIERRRSASRKGGRTRKRLAELRRARALLERLASLPDLNVIDAVDWDTFHEEFAPTIREEIACRRRAARAKPANARHVER